MRQPFLFDNSQSRFVRLLSCLLQHANSAPATGWKREFYAMKDRILNRYGTIDGHKDFDWQDVSQPCWSCGGTGGLYEHGGCYKCDGTGVYRYVFVPLSRWKLAGRVFHIPGQAAYRYDTEREIVFKGYVKHEPSPHAWSAALALSLMFDRPLAWTILKNRQPFEWIERQLIGARGIVWRLSRRCQHCGKRLLFSGERWFCSKSCEDADTPF